MFGEELHDWAAPYLRRWKFEVGQFFEGVDGDASDEQLLAIAAGIPVFRIDQPGHDGRL
jgi:hypothetical protein